MPRSIPLFYGDGRATPFLRAQWRKRVPLRPLQAVAPLVDNGAPSPALTGVWAAAFPDRSSLPDVVANPDGTGTAAFWAVFR